MLRQLMMATVLFAGLVDTSFGQNGSGGAQSGGVAERAAAYFERARKQGFDSFLQSIRPRHLPPELKTKVISMLRKEDLVNPSAEWRGKLAALAPVLQYHDRSAVIELKIIRVGQPAVLFLAGAAVLISEEALDLLTTEELQAAVAHELGHEYYWGEYEAARQSQQYEKLQELELRCDGIGIITMSRIGGNPASLISMVTKMTKAHGRKGQLMNADHYTTLEERIRFNRIMIEMVDVNAGGPRIIAQR